MKTILWLSLFSFALPSLVEAQKKEPRYVHDETTGIVLVRPSGEEWRCKKPEEGDSVFFSGTVAMVYHRLNDCGVQVMVNEKEDNQAFPKLEEMATNQVKRYGTDQNGQPIQGRKVTTKINVARKFPGAGRPKAQYIEVELDDSGRNGGKTYLRQYFFINKKNNNQLAIVTITGDQETYKENQKKILFILAKMQWLKKANK